MNSNNAEDANAKPVAFLDTNVLMRYFLRDDERADSCLELLTKADRGEIRLLTSALVIAEVVWTLRSPRYGLSPDQIRELLLPVLSLRGLHIEDKSLYGKILHLYCENHIDFTDAYNATLMWKGGVHAVYSYDKHYDRLDFVTRLEP